jgi:hypothetical protein
VSGRRIPLYCDAKSHADDAPDLAELVSEIWDDGEHWEIGWGRPDAVGRQRVVHRDDVGMRPKALEVQGAIATRDKITCPACGFCITAGDRLGLGFASMLDGRAIFRLLPTTGEPPHPFRAAKKTSDALTHSCP